MACQELRENASDIDISTSISDLREIVRLRARDNLLRTSGLHLMRAATKQLVDFLRLHILAQPCIFPSWLWWRNQGSTVLNRVLFGF